MPYTRQSMEEIESRWHETKESVGMFKPKEVLDVIAEAVPPQWDQKYQDQMSQMNLFDGPKQLERVPWAFKCIYQCDDPNCRKPHKQTIRDWEIYQLYRVLRDRHGEDKAVNLVRERTRELFTDRYDTHLVVGSIGRFCTFIIGGLFYPTRNTQSSLPLW